MTKETKRYRILVGIAFYQAILFFGTVPFGATIANVPQGLGCFVAFCFMAAFFGKAFRLGNDE